MKVFLSHKMSSLTEEEVNVIRSKMISKLVSFYVDEKIEIIDNYHHLDAPENANRIWHLGASIKQLSEADAIYFSDDIEETKGCIVEKLIAELYNIRVLNNEMK